MKVILFTHSYLPKIGGREIVVYQLARALHTLGHEVSVVGPRRRRGSSEADYGDVPTHRFPVLVPGHLSDQSSTLLATLRERETMLHLCRVLRQGGPDVVHAHTTFPAGYVAELSRRWFPATPLVITPHGIDINTIPPDFGMRLDPILRRKIDLALSRAEEVTAISTGIEASLRDAGVPGERIHLIPNGTDLERFDRQPGQSSVRQRLGIPLDARVLLTVGNYHPRKGQRRLIEALPRILADVPDAFVVVAGGGTEPLDAVARDAGVSERVLLTGTLQPPDFRAAPGTALDDLADLYAEADLYVSAGVSQGAEGLSLAVLDAMAAAKPIVATRISGNEDVVKEGINGVLVPPDDVGALADALGKLLLQPAEREALGAASRELAFEFSWLKIAGDYLAVYEQAAERRRQAA